MCMGGEEAKVKTIDNSLKKFRSGRKITELLGWNNVSELWHS